MTKIRILYSGIIHTYKNTCRLEGDLVEAFKMFTELEDDHTTFLLYLSRHLYKFNFI